VRLRNAGRISSSAGRAYLVSAPNRSSISRRRGPPSSARAIETRLPHAAGELRREILLPSRGPPALAFRAASPRRWPAAEAPTICRQLDILQRARCSMDKSAALLEHEADRAVRPRLLRAKHADTSLNLSAVAQSGRPTTRNQVDLPQPEGPIRLKTNRRARPRKENVLRARHGAPFGDESHRPCARNALASAPRRGSRPAPLRLRSWRSAIFGRPAEVA